MKKGYLILIVTVFIPLLLSQCVTGNQAAEEGILLDKYRKIVLAGETETIHASVQSNRPLLWYSSDESYVTVTQEGEITGVSSGNAVITAKTVDGAYKTYCYVTVLTEIPKNVILCIGDGMGFEQVKAAGIFENGTEGSLSFESFEYQNDMTTFSASSAITDSAASATAMATGHKVNNGVLSIEIPGDGSELETLVEFLSQRGKRSGLVTTTHITNATPAAFGSHEQSRTYYEAIALDYVGSSKPNVLFGGGGFGITTEMTNSAGYHTVTDKADFLATDPTGSIYYSAQFGTENMPYMYDYTPGTYPYPELSEMTEKALAILDQDPDGFFLLVEGGRIDHACHDNNIEYAIYETIEFEDAVDRVLEWMEGRSDTVLIITADHETGGLSVTSNNGQGEFPTVTWSTGYHTGVEVPVYLSGSDENIVFGDFDNTHIYYAISDLYE
ncbi:MAG: alkaline phosphatase [Spirochaetes bacterium]|nr:alkaline phosphatase [Spirochaetota bacterium]